MEDEVEAEEAAEARETGEETKEEEEEQGGEEEDEEVEEGEGEEGGEEEKGGGGQQQQEEVGEEEKEEEKSTMQEGNKDRTPLGSESSTLATEQGGDLAKVDTVSGQEKDSPRVDAQEPGTVRTLIDATTTGGEHLLVGESQRGATGLGLSEANGTADDDGGGDDERVGSEAGGDVSEYGDDFDEEEED